MFKLVINTLTPVSRDGEKMLQIRDAN